MYSHHCYDSHRSEQVIGKAIRSSNHNTIINEAPTIKINIIHNASIIDQEISRQSIDTGVEDRGTWELRIHYALIILSIIIYNYYTIHMIESILYINYFS